MWSIKTHNGAVTILNPATGNHRTFEVRTQKEDAKFAPGQRIVSLLAGPDNESDYQGFGFVGDDGHIRIWKKKQSPLFATYALMLERPEVYEEKGLQYAVEGRCRKCNRRLTTPQSIEAGIGPVCASGGVDAD